ncbi:MULTISPECIES: hypothetical protein [unclassified Arthrobacter]|uniref:hypothetical protein n=1 Tax=unclassified Arthrobacter TaxID=235627 RepID=UPI001F279930|nr:hypothetical protein [Arthrobacter sp. FW305-BF8]UKA52344.1 hypothetical protein LFT45_11225 [Arthrobacter sp. FW305-BF8]
MSSEASTMEFVGQVAMKWLEDFADNPKHGSYMEAVADLTTLILGGAIEAAGLVGEEGAGVIGFPDELEEEAQAG